MLSAGDVANRVATTQGRTIRQLEGFIELMTSLTTQAVFYYLASASVASALLAVTRRNPVHSMLWVLALFLHLTRILR